jgi:hypothetical protein
MTHEYDRSTDPEADAGRQAVRPAESDPEPDGAPMDVAEDPTDPEMPARHETAMERPDDPTPMEDEPTAMTDEPTAIRDDSTAMRDDSTAKPHMHGDAEDTSGMAEYRARFDEIQAQFIEEPRDAVRSAQLMVEEAVNRMMEGLRQAGTGDGADTEQLRVAMMRYRNLLYQVTETDSAEAHPLVHGPAS